MVNRRRSLTDYCDSSDAPPTSTFDKWALPQDFSEVRQHHLLSPHHWLLDNNRGGRSKVSPTHPRVGGHRVINYTRNLVNDLYYYSVIIQYAFKLGLI